MSIIFSTM